VSTWSLSTIRAITGLILAQAKRPPPQLKQMNFLDTDKNCRCHNSKTRIIYIVA
jgi:hypothetical protein